MGEQKNAGISFFELTVAVAIPLYGGTSHVVLVRFANNTKLWFPQGAVE